MAIFRQRPVPTGANSFPQRTNLSELALNSIRDGVIIIDGNGLIIFVNPAAVSMLNGGSVENILGIDYSLILKFQNKDGTAIPDDQDELKKSISVNVPFESREYALLPKNSDKRIPVDLSLILANDSSANKIITFRDITKELAEEEEQTEFISTASHEMRTPVASIEGYLGLALNPQTATIDDRARQYLESAHASSQHLGKLFQDLLDVTKLDDHKIKPRLAPVELISFTKEVLKEFAPKFAEKQLRFSFGKQKVDSTRGMVLEQLLYGYVDIDFLREILSNLLENAIKYTGEGGAVTVSMQGIDNRAIVSVSDTGIGIGGEDLKHIFQKFYRVDNSQTRTIGGTGLGLYIVKQRAEAMGGLVWAESEVGKGTTFFISLPRLTPEEYEKRKIAYENQQSKMI